MDNLLTNAIKYGAARTAVWVELSTLDDSIAVSVTNQGAGIEPEQLPYLFSRFHRAAERQHAGVKGIGLGLYIVRELVEAHGGRIVVESVPGKTTTFRFTLPLAPPIAIAREARHPN
jgi:signal transduction histidine kinase